ncbi:MAG: class I SAM-dependent methyltransferase [Anaerolineales bacterium]|nr:class I SAM-dependent methyltransferase [Anaerolineales bacterium]
MKPAARPTVWITRTYDRLSGCYDLYMKVFYPVGEKGRKLVAEKLEPGKRVLDVACGTGTLLAFAHQKGLQCSGIDLSPGMLAQARKKLPQAGLNLASFYEIPYPEEHFDYVVVTNALSATFVEPVWVISEMLRVCKRGGELYLAEWPSAPQATLRSRFLTWLARLSDDEPKDYLAVFSELGYQPKIDCINKHYQVYGIKKANGG